MIDVSDVEVAIAGFQTMHSAIVKRPLNGDYAACSARSRAVDGTK